VSDQRLHIAIDVSIVGVRIQGHMCDGEDRDGVADPVASASGARGSLEADRVSRQHHGHAARAALLPSLLIAVALGASACGGTGDTDAPRPKATPAGHGEKAVPTASPSPSARALQPGPPRTPDAVLRRIAGRRIKVAGRTIRVDADTVTCDGLGRPSQRRGDQRTWTRFRCIQPTFPPGSVAGPDLIFVVQSVPPRDLVVTRRYLTSY